MPAKRGFDRTQRVNDEIQKALGMILLQEMADERFHLVTVVGVEASRDLSFAKVYVSVMSDDADFIKQTVKDLNENMKMIRYSLAKAVKLRVTPELKFVYDESTAKGYRIGDLIDTAMKRTGKDK